MKQRKGYVRVRFNSDRVRGVTRQHQVDYQRTLIKKYTQAMQKKKRETNANKKQKTNETNQKQQIVLLSI